MALQTDFQTFFNDIELDCFENIKTTVAEITKNLIRNTTDWNKMNPAI